MDKCSYCERRVNDGSYFHVANRPENGELYLHYRIKINGITLISWILVFGIIAYMVFERW